MKIAYRIKISNLPKATKEMNCKEDGFFESEITTILIRNRSNNAIVILDIKGDYPFLTSKWKEFIEE